MSDCQHNFQFKGVVYSKGSSRPGTDARNMDYEDSFFCTKCLVQKYTNKRSEGSSYGKPIEGTMPK